MGKYIFIFLLIVGPMIPIVYRMYYYKKTSGWTEVSGNVLRTYFRLVGDSSSVFVDVRYEYDGVSYRKDGLMTDAISTNEFKPQQSVLLLVDPADPKRCDLKFNEKGTGDIAVRNFARRAFKLPR